jgi:transcriptional regulator with XRE-family HTH domain
MAQWPGLGERIRQRLVELGYKQSNGKADILAFSLKHSYLPMYLYKWVNAGVMPSRENVEKLSRDLNVSAPWLLFGNEVDKAPNPPRRRGRRALGCLVAALGVGWLTTGSVPTEDRTIAVAAASSALPLIGSVKRYWWRIRSACTTNQADLMGYCPAVGAA